MTRYMIDAERLAARLRPNAFALACDDGCSMLWYSRPSELPELWERIHIHVAGARGENVGLNAGAGVCYGAIMARWLNDERFVWETGARERPGGSRILATGADADAWERLVADTVPAMTREFARAYGPELLSRTADARAAANRYLEVFGTSDWRALHTRFMERATPSQLRESQRIALTPPTIQVRNGRDFYTTVVLGIMLHSVEVEGCEIAPFGVEVWPAPEGGNWQRKPADWSKWGLAWRIELLADRMLANYPQPMPTELPD